MSTAASDLPQPRFARMYPKAAARAERRGATDHRRQLLQGLSGRVVEIGAGNGLNFAHYPGTVTEVVAIEPEPTLRADAEDAASRAPVPVTVAAGTADALPLGDDEVDAAVASLVLCSVPDQARALTELRRVIRPGGELRFYEHVRSRRPGFARFQDLSALVWPRLMGGCEPNRQTLAAIEGAGFRIERCRGFGFPADARAYPVLPRILGAARVSP